MRKEYEISGILYCEFDYDKGVRVEFQYPEGIVDETVENFSKFFLTSKESSNKSVAFVFDGKLFLGIPQYISGTKYNRNMFLFNIIFVFCLDDENVDSWKWKKKSKMDQIFQPENFFSEKRESKKKGQENEIIGRKMGELIALYVPILKKLIKSLNSIETRFEMLSKSEENNFKKIFFKRMKKFMREINKKGQSEIQLSETTSVYLKVMIDSIMFERNHNIFNEENEDAEEDLKTSQNSKKKMIAKNRVAFLNKLLYEGKPQIPVFDDIRISNIEIYMVPFPLYSLEYLYDTNCGLLLKQVIPLINGGNTVDTIAKLSHCKLSNVIECIRHLVYFNIVKMIDLFQYSNVYVLKSKEVLFSLTKKGSKLRRVCLKYFSNLSENFKVTKEIKEKESSNVNNINNIDNNNQVLSENVDNFSEENISKEDQLIMQILRIFSRFRIEYAVKRVLADVVEFNHRDLIAFGLIHNIIERIHEVPILENFKNHSSSNDDNMSPSDESFSNIDLFLDGNHCLDEICTYYKASRSTIISELQKRFRNNLQIFLQKM